VDRKVILFTDSTPFGYDTTQGLKAEGLLDETYVQLSPVNYRLRRYRQDLTSIRGIKRRVVGLVDRINRSMRSMSIEAHPEVLDEVGAVPFITFRELRPQLATENAIVVVYGTRIVPSWVYKGAHQTINVHWGLSPHYRGILTTDRAVINGDLRNIGFTLHELSNDVDGGRIITQGRVPVQRGDTIGTITTRLHGMAKPLLIKAVADAQQAKLDTVPQELSVGKNYRGVDWSVWNSLMLRKLIPITQKAMETSRPELPIHESPSLRASALDISDAAVTTS
jgi:hypothetical protein